MDNDLEELGRLLRKTFFRHNVEQQLYVEAIAALAMNDEPLSRKAIQLTRNSIQVGKGHLGKLIFSLSMKASNGSKFKEEMELFRDCRSIISVLGDMLFQGSPTPAPYLCFLMESESIGALKEMKQLKQKLVDATRIKERLIQVWNQSVPNRPIQFDMRVRQKLDPSVARNNTTAITRRKINLFSNIVGLTQQIFSCDNDLIHFQYARKVVDMIVSKGNTTLKSDSEKDKIKELGNYIDDTGDVFVQMLEEICKRVSLTEILHVLSGSEKNSTSSCLVVDNGKFFALLGEFSNFPDTQLSGGDGKVPILPYSLGKMSMVSRLYELCLSTDFIICQSFEMEVRLERQISFNIYLSNELRSMQKPCISQSSITHLEQVLKILRS